jgi:hypothetical protein
MLIEKLEHLICETPGLTATELAFGINGYYSHVNGMCIALVYAKRAERCGFGGPGDPFRYFPPKP